MQTSLIGSDRKHCIKKIEKGLVSAGSKFYLGKGEELLDTFFFLTRP